MVIKSLYAVWSTLKKPTNGSLQYLNGVQRYILLKNACFLEVSLLMELLKAQ